MKYYPVFRHNVLCLFLITVYVLSITQKDKHRLCNLCVSVLNKKTWLLLQYLSLCEKNLHAILNRE